MLIIIYDFYKHLVVWPIEPCNGVAIYYFKLTIVTLAAQDSDHHFCCFLTTCPPPALGFEVIIWRFTNSGVRLVVANMRWASEKTHSGTSCQRILWPQHPWRHSNFDWTHNGSPSSQRFPSNPSPNTPSHICSTLSYPTLCYWCNYYWSSIVVFTAQ